MSWDDKMYSHGRCRLCGHKGKDAVTVVETVERAYRFERPWWQFWKPQRVEWKS